MAFEGHAINCVFKYFGFDNIFAASFRIRYFDVSIIIFDFHLYSIIQNFCSLLFIFAQNCSFLLIIVHLSSLLFIFANCCSSLLIIAHLCSLMLFFAHYCSSLLIIAHLCLLFFIIAQ